MAFNDPPNILAGITHPQVISTPGAGDAMAGGLSTVLAAILQKQQMDQQHQQQASDLAYKQAQTENEIKLAQLTGTKNQQAQEELKENKQKFQDTLDAQNYERTGFGFLMSHLDKANDLHGLLQAAQSAADSGAIDPKVVPYVGKALQNYQGILEQQGKAAEATGKGQTATAQGALAGPMAASQLQEQQGKAALQTAQTREANARTAGLKVDTQVAQQKFKDDQLKKYLVANNNDPVVAMTKYLRDNQMYGKKDPGQIGAAQLLTQFTALSKSPVDDLKPAQVITVSKNFEAKPNVKPILDEAPALAKTLGVLKGAAAGNGALTGAAYINMIKVFDQPKNLRYQLVNWAKSWIDPSYANDIRKGFDAKFHGTIPPNVAQDMYRGLKTIYDQEKGDYARNYQDYLQKWPQAKIQEPDEVFGKDEDFTLGGAPSDSVTAQLMKKYGLTPR